VLTHVSLPK